MTIRLADLAEQYRTEAERAREAALAALAGIPAQPPTVTDRLMTPAAQWRSRRRGERR